MEDKDRVPALIGVGLIIVIAILVTIICLLSGNNLEDEISKANTITICGQTYDTSDVKKVEYSGGLYDEVYTITLKDGTKIHFKEYKLEYKD